MLETATEVRPAASMAIRVEIRADRGHPRDGRSRLGLRLLAAATAWLAIAAVPAPAAGDPPPIGGVAPNFALTTQQNDRVWLAGLRGRAVVLAFGCTACGACPELVPRLADLAGDLGDARGRRVLFLLVTVDPQRDTPRVLGEFGRAHGLRAPAWILLTEERAGQVEAVARRYGVAIRRAPEGIEADCVVTVVDPGGRIRARRHLGSIEALRGDLRALLGPPTAP
jgi:cytochrome oxidase Cu insertion factor (SCO1/SenC/PrrC family)